MKEPAIRFEGAVASAKRKGPKTGMSFRSKNTAEA